MELRLDRGGHDVVTIILIAVVLVSVVRVRDLAGHGLDGHHLVRFDFLDGSHRSVVNVHLLLGREHPLDLLEGFALGLGQEEVDEEEAGDAPAHVEPEGTVLAHGFIHIAEASDDDEDAQQVEARRE